MLHWGLFKSPNNVSFSNCDSLFSFLLLSFTCLLIFPYHHKTYLLIPLHYIFQSQAIKRTTEKKMEEVYNMFNRELKMVNKELNQRARDSLDHMPRIAGQAHWARALRHRLDKPMEVNLLYYTIIYMYSFWYTLVILLVCKVKNLSSLPWPFPLLSPFLYFQVLQAHFMPESYSRKQVVLMYNQLVQVLDEIVRNNFSMWSQNLDGQYLKRLEQPLMVRCKDKTAKLNINFDKWATQTQCTQ